ncbi:hypothetical protein GCM10011410_14760 [Hoyosella rhizosphaerae]|uniref:Uncharacterized protein n=1 Tax=Hoyosella rhizosphaerae TaxID=1755582 RepID=A0A916U8H3_9ACTN|nr:hypothetical protein GCM10011410_14760 [Hoyosella rhizosphaerae]
MKESPSATYEWIAVLGDICVAPQGCDVNCFTFWYSAEYYATVGAVFDTTWGAVGGAVRAIGFIPTLGVT